MQGRKRKIGKRLFSIALVFMIISSSGLFLLQEKILFRPKKLELDFTYKFNQPFEELFIPSDDATINAIHFKAENPKGVIFYLHGNKGNLTRWGKIAEYFVNYQYDVLVIDYRTYGKSEGKISENALYKDAQTCYNYIKKIYAEDKIHLYGRSLGTGLATYLASKNKPNQLILETPYYSMHDVVKRYVPFLPVKQIFSYELPSYQFIEQINHCQITIIHGTNDRVIPLKSAQKLYNASQKNNVSFLIIDQAGHNNIDEYIEYHQLIKTVL